MFKKQKSSQIVQMYLFLTFLFITTKCHGYRTNLFKNNDNNNNLNI